MRACVRARVCVCMCVCWGGGGRQTGEEIEVYGWGDTGREEEKKGRAGVGDSGGAYSKPTPTYKPLYSSPHHASPNNLSPYHPSPEHLLTFSHSSCFA